nr:PREDICTED: putative polypeptide N-acetylgalactosaminyltransferase 10 [Bemisia tabaci]XP_018908726.1 PREDICTED: putative polypeptide N-acetylgalactosaminyltransferase 10 [Bemisia tabaci]
MKRNVKACCKNVILAVLTASTTVLVFHLVRGIHPEKYQFDSVENHAILPVPPKNQRRSALETDDKKDWHNYRQIEEEARRKGPGEQGAPAKLPPNHDVKKYNALYEVNGFNALISDSISLNRSLPDIRHEGCKNEVYRRNLPTVSVVVPFHNEHWSTLLRTVYSVLNRSPASLIKEIILVDDFSSKEHSKKPLDDYVRKNLPEVKVIHLQTRQGLIRARLAGAKAATAEVLIFLDSHSEANVNWLPPLLDPIAEDYKTCVCPFIDVIDFENFQYRAQDEGARGAFDWEFFYKRLPLLDEDKRNPTKPFKSPVMAGGLFAISTKFFWELGGYDPGLDIWGGEQYELSFKIWQCGGRMLDAPCSRVGHIYRKFAPFPNPGIGNFVGRNYRRVAEVWMDEYAEYLYLRRPSYRDIDPGDLSAQKKIREKLKCKSFKWFMENIAFDLAKHYPPIEPPDYASGEVKNYVAPEYCVDTEHKNQDMEFGLQECTSNDDKHEQQFQYTWHKDVRTKGRTMCWDVSSSEERAPVKLYPCHGSKGNQFWRYNPDKMILIHGTSGRCLDCDLGRKTIFVTHCDSTSESQKWIFKNFNRTALLQIIEEVD